MSKASIVGLILVCIGLLANPWTLVQFSSDGVLEFEIRAQIWFFDGVMVLLGVILIVWSRRPPVPGFEISGKPILELPPCF
jgi:hypothetical protein